MKIYTKTGDDGTTGLFGGGRVPKSDARVRVYGTVDELNAVLGVAATHTLAPLAQNIIESLQVDLFTLGAELATVPDRTGALKIALLGDEDVSRLERAIDASEATLPALKHFVLPGGSPGAAALHHARTVCRRAERECVDLAAHEPVRDTLVVYLNRLSDLLFSLARATNQSAGIDDVPWTPR